MQVAAQDVFDEIVANQVPLEEWPTYIFTRVFSASGAKSEVDALKAVAQTGISREALRST